MKIFSSQKTNNDPAMVKGWTLKSPKVNCRQDLDILTQAWTSEHWELKQENICLNIDSLDLNIENLYSNLWRKKGWWTCSGFHSKFVTHPCIVLRMQHPDVVGLNALVEEVESKNPDVMVKINYLIIWYCMVMKINQMAWNIARNGDDDILNNWSRWSLSVKTNSKPFTSLQYNHTVWWRKLWWTMT